MSPPEPQPGARGAARPPGLADGVREWGKRRRRLLNPAALLLCLVPAVLCFAYVRAFGVTVVYSDQWEVVSLFERLSAGTLTFEHLFRLHNEHRFFFPRIVMLGLGSLTAWNNIAEMYLIVAMLTASAGIMLLAFRRSFGPGAVILFVPVAFLVLTLRQHLNLLWGYQITFALTQLAAVASLYALYLYSGRPGAGRWVAFAAAVACAVVASGSSVQGLMVWLAGLLPLFTGRRDDGNPRIPRTGLVLWIFSGALVWVLYFYDYQPAGSSNASPLDVLAEPVYGAVYGLTIVGASLTFASSVAVLAGALIFASLISTIFLLLRRGGREAAGRYSFWLSVCTFSLLVLALISAGRFSSGLDGALASRYVTFSAPLLAGVYALNVGLWRESRGKVLPVAQLALAAGLILFSQAIHLDNAYARGAQSEEDRRAVAQLVLTREERTDRELTENIRFGANGIRGRADTLERLGLNIFHEPQAIR
ncbi:hypothetical protein [Rubrobacter indicoceani]|uniref:hypothetical protein n=1 Tax=Rubrobacter indicoceani TaxID=2051957 RepID=UPI000E5AAD57|nr:hypothetical protein [Rubrobacter indicoceani]